MVPRRLIVDINKLLENFTCMQRILVQKILVPVREKYDRMCKKNHEQKKIKKSQT